MWATSDTHGWLPKPPSESDAIDLAIIAGDFCQDFIGSMEQVRALQLNWLETEAIPWLRTFPPTLPVILIWGNHDFIGHRSDLVSELPWPVEVIPLNDTWVEVGGWRVYGSPWSHCPKGWAFRLGGEEELRDKVLSNAPDHVTLLVSHQPPMGPAGLVSDGVNIGSTWLDGWVRKEGVRVVVCGHIHEAAGIYEPTSIRPYLTVNAARCDPQNRPVRGGVVFSV